MNTATLGAVPTYTARQEAATMGLIGLAHGTSHFHHLLLAPLFPVFIRDFGLSYSQLGLLVTVFFVISGIGQALAGFVVDRIGARPVLWAAMACFVAASLTASVAQGYGGLALAAALAGMGNAPFHPADFTILNKRIRTARLGHAFSVHGISGNLGWALAPVFLIGVSSATGQWRMAYVAASLIGLGVLALLVVYRDAIDDRPQQAFSTSTSTVHDSHSSHAAAIASTAASTSAAEHPLAFMKLPSVWLCFSFFFWTTAALSAIQSFASPALSHMYGIPVSATAFVVTGYMLCGAVGMVLGGFLMARVQRLERLIAVAMMLAVVLLLLTASGWLSAWGAGLAASLAGLGTGLAGPSRDMLIKKAAPPGATGRVYGTVYSALDIGFALAAPVFGALMDHGHNQAVFAGAALMLLLGMACATLVGNRIARGQN